MTDAPKKRVRIRRTIVKDSTSRDILAVPIDELVPDKTNPRQADEARLGVLRVSLDKLRFMLPVMRQKSTGLLLSGHQRQYLSRQLGFTHLPTMDVDVDDKDILGINVLCNRASNDFSSHDTGSKAFKTLNMREVLKQAEALPDLPEGFHFAYNCKEVEIEGILQKQRERYDRNGVISANTLLRRGVRIPAVVSESGRVVNGVHRLFSAAEAGVKTWPVITIPDEYAEVANNMLNYLSMDYRLGEDFKALLRAGAFRRIANDKGIVPKSYRFWANGNRTLLDRDSYTPQAWANFRSIHGASILDFGAGLCKVAPYLRSKGFDAYDFEPFRFDPDKVSAEPCPDYSRAKAAEFLHTIANPAVRFDSIFLSAVLNSVPFLEDRLKLLVIVHALSDWRTEIYGTCRDISDFTYEYQGERRGTMFTMDEIESGTRLGDLSSRPKLQKFMSQDEAKAMFDRFWGKAEFWPGGNIFYWRLTMPRRANLEALKKSLIFEFGDLPFLDGTTMGMADLALECFGKRLGVNLK